MQTATLHRLPAAALEMLPAICRQHHVHTLDLFGSATTTRFDAGNSDIDLVVDFEDIPVTGQADLYFGLHNALEVLFERHVDLLTARSIENPHLRRSIELTRQRLYAAP